MGGGKKGWGDAAWGMSRRMKERREAAWRVLLYIWRAHQLSITHCSHGLVGKARH